MGQLKGTTITKGAKHQFMGIENKRDMGIGEGPSLCGSHCACTQTIGWVFALSPPSTFGPDSWFHTQNSCTVNVGCESLGLALPHYP